TVTAVDSRRNRIAAQSSYQVYWFWPILIAPRYAGRGCFLKFAGSPPSIRRVIGDGPMALVPASPLHRQFARASRRLFFQTLIDNLAWSCAAALGLGAGWFVAEPYFLSAPDAWLRWAVAGGLLGS